MEDVAPFIMVDKRLFREVRWVSPVSGEVFPFPAMDKLIYLYLKDRWEFFTLQEGKEYYENQDTIAEACGVSRKKVNNVIGKFIKEGVIEAHKVKVDSGVSLVYDVINPLTVVGKEGQMFAVK